MKKIFRNLILADWNGLEYLARAGETGEIPMREDAFCAMFNSDFRAIPIKELPEGLPEKMKFYGWLDTPENRRHLREYAGELSFRSNQDVLDEACELMKAGYWANNTYISSVAHVYAMAVAHPDTKALSQDMVRELGALLDKKINPHMPEGAVLDFYKALYKQLSHQKYVCIDEKGAA